MHHSYPKGSLPGVRSMDKLLASTELASAFKRGSHYYLESSHATPEKRYTQSNFCLTSNSSNAGVPNPTLLVLVRGLLGTGRHSRR